MLKEAAKQELQERGAWGYFEPLLAMGSAVAVEPISGLVGLAGLPFGVDGAAQSISKVRKALTYQPRSAEGQRAMQAIGEALQPLGDAFEGASSYLGDSAFEATGSPELSAAAYSVPTAALELLGLKGVGKLKATPFEVGDIGTQSSNIGGKQRGIFAGVKAQGADLKQMEAAQELASRGVSRDEIWGKTGWFEDVDGAWKWEIDDSKYQFNLPEKAAGQQLADAYHLMNRLDDMSESDLLLEMELMDFKGTPSEYKAIETKGAYDKLYDISRSDYPLETVIEHRDMLNAYPDMKQVDAQFRDSWQSSTGGAYTPSDDSIRIGSKESGKGSVMAHEMQHAIQEREGFAKGGSPEMAKSALATAKSAALSGKYKYDVIREELKNRGLADYIYRLDKLSKSDNIKPSQITNLSDYYAYSDKLRDKFGALPRKDGPERNEWLRSAAAYIKNKNLERVDIWERDAIARAFSDPKANKREYSKLTRKINKAQPDIRRMYDQEAKFNELQKLSDVEQYKRLTGEAEARNVQTRLNFTPEQRRATPPWETLDVPEDELITRF